MLGHKTGKLLIALILLLGAGAGHIFEALRVNGQLHPADYAGKIQSLSFSPVGRYESAESGVHPSLERIRDDMRVVAGVTRKIRTYTVDGTMAQVPAVARAFGLKVSLGVWVDDHNPARTEREITDAAREALKYPDTVEEIIIGSEALLRGDSTPEHLSALMDDMRGRTGGKFRITTSEVWPIWLENPELARHADFVAAHILPYWDKINPQGTVNAALEDYRKLQDKFPGKEIMISEFGWPSGLLENGDAVTSRAAQASVIREFLTRAGSIRYNIIEAFDQPWKVNEGNSGPYWGLFDADRHMKFPLTGFLENDSSWRGRTLFSVLTGFMLALPFCIPWGPGRRNTFTGITVTAIMGQCVGAMTGNVVWEPFLRYCSPGLLVSWIIGAPLVMLLVMQCFERIRETVYILTANKPVRIPTVHSGNSFPFVSIHVPACREQPYVLLRTLRALSAMNWPDFEVICLMNNTDDGNLTEPVRTAIESNPEYRYVRYVNLGRCDGFKAGALNRGLLLTAPHAEFIGVVDADYVVEADWLLKTMGAFNDTRTAMVQVPQEHYAVGILDRAMNAEYAGFFDGGMVERNEDDAIIAHGTMLLLRRTAMAEVGGWDENFICEDTELGLRLFRAGWSAVYTRERYGRGVLPDTLQGFRKQRDRWAYGAMRIALHHFRAFLPGVSGLSGARKYHFVMGWLHWAGDAAAVILAFTNLIWALWIIFSGTGEPPPVSLSVATLTAAFVTVMHMSVLHMMRVRRGFASALLAALAGTSLQMTVGTAVVRGLLHGCSPFHITPKGGSAAGRTLRHRAWSLKGELFLGFSLPAAAIAVYLHDTEAPFAWKIYCVLLCVLAVPHIFAVLLETAEYPGAQKKKAVFSALATLKTAGAD